MIGANAPLIWRKVTKALPWDVASKGTAFLFGLVSSVLIVRGLGPDRYGQLSVANSVARYLILLAGLGLGPAALRYVPEALRVGGRTAFRRLAGQMVGLQCVAWMGVLAVVMLARRSLVHWYGQEVLVLIVLAVGVSVFQLAKSVLQAVPRARYQTRFLFSLSTVNRVLTLCLLLWVVGQPWALRGIVAMDGVVVLVSVLVMLAYFRWQPIERLEGAGGHIQARRLMVYSLPVMVTSMVNLVVWRQSEVLFLGYFGGAVAAGQFNLAYGFAQNIMTCLSQAAWSLAMVWLTELHLSGGEHLQHGATLYSQGLFVVGVPLAAVGWVFGDVAIQHLYGADMAVAGQLCRWFFPIFSLSFFWIALRTLCYVTEQSWVVMLKMGVLAVVNVLLDWWLISHYGVWGGVIAVTLTIGLGIVLMLLLARWRLGGMSLPWGFIARCYAGSLPVLLLRPLHPLYSRDPLALVGWGFCGVVAAVCGMAVLGVFRRELWVMATGNAGSSSLDSQTGSGLTHLSADDREPPSDGGLGW